MLLKINFSILNLTDKYLHINDNFLQSYKYFHPYKNEIRQIFRCEKNLIKKIKKLKKQLFK